MADIRVQVCYAHRDRQILMDLIVPDGADVKAAIERSGVLEMAPEFDLRVCRVGIYGKLKTLDTVLREHDRVEIYRPLVADPKEARRKRVAKKEEEKAR